MEEGCAELIFYYYATFFFFFFIQIKIYIYFIVISFFANNKLYTILY